MVPHSIPFNVVRERLGVCMGLPVSSAAKVYTLRVTTVTMEASLPASLICTPGLQKL